MAYKRIVETVVETPGYLALARKLFNEKEMADIVSLLACVYWRLTRKWVTYWKEPGDFASCVLPDKVPGRAVAPALSTSSATRNIRYF